ncbi:MAG: T9SS type A sorting domain-containing protein [Ignavibacteriae bacterium]|nr:T9SS type A sorting domain-containing protein [Ignavibacteria bacterium]MBI3364841.1 T9SS type A sorting domain-containing protein [Ignavibacteriota bacterium]
MISYTIATVHGYPSHELLEDFTLHQNSRNPFNPSTTIRYELPERSFITLRIFNILGEEVATIVNEFQEAGNKSVNFNAIKQSHLLASGVYFYRLTATSRNHSFSNIQKMVFLK